MPEVVPSIIAPYLEQRPATQSLTLVTSTLSTPAHWLLLRHVYATLTDTHGPNKGGASKNETTGTVIFVSLIRPRDLWHELSRKFGLDLPLLAKNKRFIYIDGLTSLSDGAGSALPATSLRSLTLEHITSTLNHSLLGAKVSDDDSDDQAQKPTVVIDGLDFLLASRPATEATQLQQFLMKILSASRSLVISCQADAPLLHQRDEIATPLEREHASLITTLAHQASLVMQLRGLDTGAARDVTGVMRISHGGQYEGDEETAANTGEGEWLYQCKSDGSVRIWSRGE